MVAMKVVKSGEAKCRSTLLVEDSFSGGVTQVRGTLAPVDHSNCGGGKHHGICVRSGQSLYFIGFS
jgi:hypothetical protein